MRSRHLNISYVADRRLVVNAGAATTTGITAFMPMSLTLIEAIAKREWAVAVGLELGPARWDAGHNSGAFTSPSRCWRSEAGLPSGTMSSLACHPRRAWMKYRWPLWRMPVADLSAARRDLRRHGSGAVEPQRHPRSPRPDGHALARGTAAVGDRRAVTGNGAGGGTLGHRGPLREADGRLRGPADRTPEGTPA